jgi:hypothetical protein
MTGADYASYTENGEGYFLDLATMAWFQTQYATATPARGTLHTHIETRTSRVEPSRW